MDLPSRGCACTLQLPGVNVCKTMNMKQILREEMREDECAQKNFPQWIKVKKLGHWQERVKETKKHKPIFPSGVRCKYHSSYGSSGTRYGKMASESWGGVWPSFGDMWRKTTKTTTWLMLLLTSVPKCNLSQLSSFSEAEFTNREQQSHLNKGQPAAALTKLSRFT